MWIFLSNSFLSIVKHRGKTGTLLVRARVKGDIEQVFPKAKVVKTPSADYLYRAEVSRAAVAKALAEQVERIEYDNFKSSVDDPDRHVVCHRIWQLTSAMQLKFDND